MQSRRDRLGTNRQPGFTLIELMVVILIISLLVGILVPTLTGARDKAKRLVCQKRLKDIGTAMTEFLRTSNDRFPDSDFFEAGGMVGQATGSINALLGSQTPAADRPLNKLMQDPEVFQCPSDIGDPLPKPVGGEDPEAGSAAVDGPYYLSHGSSYIFASHSEDPMFVNDPIPTYGVGSLRNKFSSRMKRPGKKIVFSEPMFSPEVRMSSGLAQWHDKNRNHSNVLFGDTSVKMIFTLPEEKSPDPKKKDDHWYGPDSKPDPSFPYY